jgi:hypothetical protein
VGRNSIDLSVIPDARKGVVSLKDFDVIPVETDGERALDWLDGDHETTQTIYRQQNPFHATQRAASDAHPLADSQEGMIIDRNFANEKPANRVNLLIGNRPSDSVWAYKTDYARGP